MTVIRPSSISGITSITSPSSSDLLSIHTNNTTEVARVTASGINVTGNTDTDTLNVSGISTFGDDVKVTAAEGKIEATGATGLTLNASHGSAYARIRTAGSERLRIDSSGRLLLGTTTEGYVSADNLTVADAANAGITIRSGTGNLGTLAFSDGTTGAAEYDGYIQYSQSSQYMDFGGAGGNIRLRIDSGGRLLVGHTASRSVGNITSQMQLEGTDASTGISITRNSNNSSAPYISFAKSRAGAVGGNTIIQNNDKLGEILFSGADGTDITNNSASINAAIDGTPGGNDTPGRLTFNTTADGGTSPIERLRINSSGHMILSPSGYSLPTGDERTLNIVAWGNKPASLGFQRASSLGGSTAGWSNELQSNGDLIWGVHNVGEKLRITAAGYLGINQTPYTRLDVKQDNGVAYNGNAQSIAYNAARFHNTSGHTGGGTYTGFQFNISGDSQNRICSVGMISQASNSKLSSLVFHTDDGSNRTEKMRITSGGQVNIGGDLAQTSNALYVQGSPGIKVQGGTASGGNANLLELKHPDTASSSGAGDGPALLLNGGYQGNPWAFAKICSVNSGSGYGADFQIHVHPANGTQGASLVKALSIVGDGASGADVMLPDGNIKFASGHGVSFINAPDIATGETVSSSVLDDYEEGTFTPTIRCSAGTGQGGSSQGFYTKVGRLVTCHGTLNWTSLSGTTASYAQIQGLPYTTLNASGYRSGAVLGGQVIGVYWSGLDHAYINFGCDANMAAFYITAVNMADHSGANYTHTPNIASTGTLYGFTLIYYTA